MSSAELNIIERGLGGQAWTAEKGPVTTGDLDKVTEQCTCGSVALGAVPSPFARFYVVKEAFRLAYEQLLDPRKRLGDAYGRLVSDTLDVFELLYNLTYHEQRWGKGSRSIEILEWDSTAQLARLRETVPVLAGAVGNYFGSDLGASGDKLCFVVLKDGGHDYLLASTSPYTGFVTPPDLDKKVLERGKNDTGIIGQRYEHMPVMHRKGGGEYFRDSLMLEKRDKEFKNYMLHLVNSGAPGAGMRYLRDYVKRLSETDPDFVTHWVPDLRPVMTDESNPLAINGIVVEKDNGLSTVNFFNDTLIMLPFRLSRDYEAMARAGEGEGQGRGHDYLLPIRSDVLCRMEGDFACSVKETKMKTVVKLLYKGREYTKEYASEARGRDRAHSQSQGHGENQFQPCCLPRHPLARRA